MNGDELLGRAIDLMARDIVARAHDELMIRELRARGLLLDPHRNQIPSADRNEGPGEA